MNRAIGRVGAGLFGIAVLAAPVWGGGLPADEQAFLDKHMSEVVAVAPVRLNDDAVAKAFSAPIYELTITVNSGDGGSSTQKQIAAKVEDKLVPVSRPGTDQDCPSIFKMMNPAFTLKTDDDAKALQAAFDKLYPLMDNDKPAEGFTHSGNTWNFSRGTFFSNKLGFVLTTDGGGKVTAVKFSLKL